MKRWEKRLFLAVGVGFVAYRICVEFMGWPSALLIGLIGLAVTLGLTGRSKPTG